MQNFQSYVQSPQLLFSFRPGTLALLPGLAVGVMVIVLYLRRKCVQLPRVTDAGAVGATGALLVLSLGDFLTGSKYGAAADILWGVEQWGAVRHPVQLYNALALALILTSLLHLQPKMLAGELFWRFVLLYSVSQLVVHTFYANAATWGPGIRVWQTAALIGLLASMYVLSFYARLRERQDIGVSGLRKEPMAETIGSTEPSRHSVTT